MEMMKVTLLPITEFELISTIELTNVFSEIRLGGFGDVHFPSIYYILTTASTGVFLSEEN